MIKKEQNNQPKKIKCPMCNGNKTIGGKECPKCKGTGEVELLHD